MLMDTIYQQLYNVYRMSIDLKEHKKGCFPGIYEV